MRQITLAGHLLVQLFVWHKTWGLIRGEHMARSQQYRESFGSGHSGLLYFMGLHFSKLTVFLRVLISLDRLTSAVLGRTSVQEEEYLIRYFLKLFSRPKQFRSRPTD